MSKRRVFWSVCVWIAMWSNAWLTLANERDARPVEAKLSRVVLYSTGIGYFEYLATVQDNQSVQMTVADTDLNDVLKSLVVDDDSGGKIVGATYDRAGSAMQALDALRVNVTADASLVGLLSRLQGETMRVVTKGSVGETLQGTILGVETSSHITHEGTTAVEQIVMMVGTEIRRVPSLEIQSVQFDDPKWNQEIINSLKLQQDASHDDVRKLQLRCEGTGTRRIRCGYVCETPVWKMAYRLLLGDGPEGQIQGWAIVENETDSDWTNVELTLIHGQPSSYRMDLREPLFILRNEVEVAVSATPAPQLHQGTDLTRPVPRSANSEMMRMGVGGFGGGLGGMGRGMSAETEPVASAAAAPLDAESVSAEATPSRDANFFKYAVDRPVSIGPHRSAMIPILQQPLPVERVAVFNESLQSSHPLLAASLRNASLLDLAQGPVAIFDRGVFAGEGILGFLPRGQSRLVSYGTDLDLVIRMEEPTVMQEISSIDMESAAKLVVHSIERTTKVYHIGRRGNESKHLIIELPHIELGQREKPTTIAESTESWDRYRIAIEADQTPLEAVVAVSSDQQLEIATETDARLQQMLADTTLSPAARTHLEQTMALRQVVAESRQRVARLQAKLSEMESEQGRIRANLQAIKGDDALYRQFAEQLAQFDVTFQRARQELDQAKAELQSHSERLNMQTSLAEGAHPAVAPKATTSP